MNDKQFNTIVQMIAQLSQRIEEVHTSLSARIDALTDRVDTLSQEFHTFKRTTQNNFRDQASMLQEIATAYDTAPSRKVL